MLTGQCHKGKKAVSASVARSTSGPRDPLLRRSGRYAHGLVLDN
jgi:hypothetical protein